MSTPAQPEWTLTARHTHGTDGQLLVGCHITINATNTAYQFTQPNVNNVLATSTGTTLPTAAFTFPAFDYNGLTGVSISMDTPVASGTNWGGTWSCTGSPPIGSTPPPQGPQSGDFTAQAGTKLDEDADEAASSANA
jgi:hypothetical protein